MLTFFVCLFLARWLYCKSSWKRARLAWAVVFFLFAGCSRLGQVPTTTLSIPSITLGPKTNLANPINVNTQDSEFLWNQIVDTVEDYFQIKSEQRPTRDNTQWFEGRLETFPQIGATYLEPWRKDALEGFQRWQSTLQTMRRTATKPCIPDIKTFSDMAAETKGGKSKLDEKMANRMRPTVAKARTRINWLAGHGRHFRFSM